MATEQALGPLVLVEGDKPIVDIVFLHGLRGHRIRTWQQDHGKTGQEPVWQRDFLPDLIPNARIITYGYDADIVSFFNKTNQNSVSDHASSLMDDLIRIRRGQPKVCSLYNLSLTFRALLTGAGGSPSHLRRS